MKDASTGALITRLAPGLFVLLWSSGFIGTKYGLPYAPPFTFVLARMIIACTILTTVSLVLRAPWPRRWQDLGHLAVAGLLVHGTYLGGVSAAIAEGVPAGQVALIVGLQPLLTAAVAGPLLGERVTARQWLGLLLGLAGVWLVVSQKTGNDGVTDAGAIAWTVMALLGITGGTLYQKRFCTGMDLRSGTAVQYLAAGTMAALLAFTRETPHLDVTASLALALLWLVFVLSFGAIFLLFTLIRHGQAARVASLFYLTPPTTAIMAWALFGEHLAPSGLLGFAVAAAGVALTRR